MSKKQKKHYTPKKQKNLLDFSLNYIHQRITNDLPYMYSAVALACMPPHSVKTSGLSHKISADNRARSKL